MLSFDFGDKNSYTDFGILISKRPSIPSAKRRVDFYNIPGRSGTLKYDENTYEDITITLECSLRSTDLLSEIDKIKYWLFSSAESELIFSFQKDKKYIAQVVNSIDIKQVYKYLGYFPIIFSCHPFKYHSDDNILIPYASPFTFKNTGTLPSEPIITIYGSGLIKLKVNDEVIELHDVDGIIELDSELMECYSPTELRNGSMYGEFPLFRTGDNKISWEGTVSNIYIKPNFRSL
ncbi:distal tail protein Dit [Clostridium polynesiense]|uniref:distal tail protein Dit n=1 Tax=Clostridium polynesiense TaxID=1325933 RepID=UPI0005910939|nr:distal tail protein Dit [Clostridium polynesiense]